MQAEEQSRASSIVRVSLLVVEALLALYLAAWWLPARAAWIDGGVLFAGYVVLAGWLLVAAGAWVRGSMRGVSWTALLLGPVVLGCFYLGANSSSDNVISFMALPYFVTACLLWAVLMAPLSVWTPTPQPQWLRGALVLAAGLAVGVLVVGLRAWALGHLVWPEDKTSLIMLLLPRLDGGASDIYGAAFRQWWALLPVAAVVLAFGALLAWRRSLGTRQLLGSFFALSVLGKIAFAGLSAQGYGIIPRKIISMNTNFFMLSKLVDEKGVFGFLSTFNAQQAGMGYHADTHPPLAMLVYWVLKHLSFGSPTVTALGVMAISALAIWPLYRLGEALADEELGLAMVVLYISSPMCLILGNAGADSMGITLMAFAAWLLVRSALQGGLKDAGIAGMLLGLAGMLSFASNAGLVFLGTLGLLLVWRKEKAWAPFLLRSGALWGCFLVGMLAVQGFFWAASGFHFDYAEAIRTARFVHSQANQYRPYELWSWANTALYAGYAGAGLMGLWVLAQARSLFGADTRDLSIPVSAAFVLTMVFAAYGRAEVQRQFLFGLVFLLPAAATALPRGEDGRLLKAGLAFALLMNLATAVLLQVYVLDYW